MVNKSSAIYNEARNNLRIKESRHIQWRVNDGDIKGNGIIRNISTTGMLLETNSNFIPTDGCRFSFDTSLGHDNFIPQNGKLVWHKKKPFSKNKYLCGVRFVEPGEYVLTKLRGRVQKGIKSIAIRRRLKRVINACLILVMIAMTIFISYESVMIYRDITETNERLLDVTQQQALLTRSYMSRLEATQMELASVSEELAATRTLYSESQGLLGEVRVDLELTKAVLADTEAYLENTKADLRRSQTESATLRSDMADLEIRLSNAQSAAKAAASLAQEQATSAQQAMAKMEKAASASAKAIPVIPLNDEEKQNLTAKLAQMEQLNDKERAKLTAQITRIEELNAQEKQDLMGRIAQIEQARAGEKTQMQDAIALLEEKNRQLTQELQGLQTKWTTMTTSNIRTEAEARQLLAAYQAEVAKVKGKLQHFRQQAQQIRQDALVERDRIRSEVGNNGYFVRNGKPVQVDVDKYRTAGLDKAKGKADIQATAKAGTTAPEVKSVGSETAAPVAAGKAAPRTTQAQAKPKQPVQVDVTFVE